MNWIGGLPVPVEFCVGKVIRGGGNRVKDCIHLISHSRLPVTAYPEEEGGDYVVAADTICVGF